MSRQQRALLLHGGYIGGHRTGYYAGGTGARGNGPSPTGAITGQGMDIGNYGASFAEVWCKGTNQLSLFPTHSILS